MLCFKKKKDCIDTTIPTLRVQYYSCSNNIYTGFLRTRGYRAQNLTTVKPAGVIYKRVFLHFLKHELCTSDDISVRRFCS